MSLSSDPRLPQLPPTAADDDSIAVAFWNRFQERFYQLWRELSREMDSTQNRLPTQGADIASANNLSLTTGNDYFHITGNTQVNLIDNNGRVGGDRVILNFDSTPTVKHNQAASGTYRPILLAGSADFVASANDMLTLLYDSVEDQWLEVARTVI